MVNVENIGFTQVVGCYDSVILRIGEQWWLCYVTKEIIFFFFQPPSVVSRLLLIM